MNNRFSGTTQAPVSAWKPEAKQTPDEDPARGWRVRTSSDASAVYLFSSYVRFVYVCIRRSGYVYSAIVLICSTAQAILLILTNRRIMTLNWRTLAYTSVKTYRAESESTSCYLRYNIEIPNLRPLRDSFITSQGKGKNVSHNPGGRNAINS